MKDSLSIAEARDELPDLAERLAEEGNAQAVAVTRDGKPVLAILPWEFFESLVETMDILGDEEAMAALRRSVLALDEGDTVPWEQVKAELGLE